MHWQNGNSRLSRCNFFPNPYRCTTIPPRTRDPLFLFMEAGNHILTIVQKDWRSREVECLFLKGSKVQDLLHSYMIRAVQSWSEHLVNVTE